MFLGRIERQKEWLYFFVMKENGDNDVNLFEIDF